MNKPALHLCDEHVSSDGKHEGSIGCHVLSALLRVHRCVTCHDYFDCSDANCVEPPFTVCEECKAEEKKRDQP